MSLFPCACWFYIRIKTANFLCLKLLRHTDHMTLSLSLLTNRKYDVISRNRNAETIFAAHIEGQVKWVHLSPYQIHLISSYFPNGSLVTPFNRQYIPVSWQFQSTRFWLHWLVYIFTSQRCLAKVRLALQFYQINSIKFWIYWGCQEIYSFQVRLFHLTVMLADENIHKSRRLKSITCALC